MEGGSMDKIALFLCHIRLASVNLVATEHGDPAQGNPRSSYNYTKKRRDFTTIENVLDIKPAYF
jgi:hypothetical protein